MTNNKYFEVERITNGASGEKRTTKTFKDEEKAIAYAKRYHRTTKTIKSVKTTVYCFNGTDTGITYRANTKDGTEKDYRASEQKQATEVKPDEQTTEEKEYIFFSPKTGRYAARRFRGTEEAVIADTERRIEERDYARDFCLVIREVISKGKSKFIKAINWNDDYRIACGWYSEIVYSKEEAMKKAQELANKENKAVNVYITTLNNDGHAVEELIDTVKPFKGQTYEINGRWFTLATEDEAITLAKTMANDKNRTVRINRNGVTITKVIPERKYRFVPTESANVTAVTFGNTEEITVTFEGTDTEKQAIKFAEEMSAKNNRFYEIYEIVLGDKNKYIKTVKPKEQEQEKKLIGYRVGLGGTIYNTAEEAFKNNPKDEKQVFRIVEKDELTWSYEPIDKPIEKEVKTLQDWEKKGGNFTDFCKVGDKVDKGIVDYFVDVLPPITWRTDLVQCGEPYGHRDNPETGRWEAMYITFAKNDNGQWYYAGICFLNQREAIA